MTSQPIRPGFARVGLLTGGTFQHVATHGHAADVDVLVYADVPSEVDGIGNNGDVLTIRLAAGETLRTLAAGFNEPQFDAYLREHPGVNLNHGLGALRQVGKQAADQLLANPEFGRVLRTEVLDAILLKHNGALEQVEIVVASSMAGGTGGPVGPVMADAIARIFLERTDAIVVTRFVRVGALSYTGIGDRVTVNAAANLMEDLSYVTDDVRHEREIRELVLVELPMVLRDKPARDQYAVQFMQAFHSPGVRELLARSSANEAFDSRYGTITIVRPSWFNGVPDRNVASDAVHAYLPDLQRALAAGVENDLFGRLEFELKEVPAEEPTTEELISLAGQAAGVEPSNFRDLCAAPTIHCRLLAIPTMFQRQRVSVLAPTFRQGHSHPCSRVKEFARKLTVLRSLDAKLAEAQSQFERTAADLAVSTNRHARELESSLDRWFPKTAVSRALKSAVWNPRDSARRLGNAINRLRAVANERQRLRPKLQAVQTLRAWISEELTTESQRLSQVIAVLQPSRLASAADDQPLVKPIPLDEILPELLNLATEGADAHEGVSSLLAQCTETVTPAGMIHITGAAEARPSAIATRLRSRNGATVAPAWGGKKALRAGRSIIVLPPVEAELAEDLRNHLRLASRGNIELCVADSARGGANVVALDVYKPRHLAEVFTRLLARSLQEAAEEPYLYLTNGADITRYLKQLGIGARSDTVSPSIAGT